MADASTETGTLLAGAVTTINTTKRDGDRHFALNKGVVKYANGGSDSTKDGYGTNHVITSHYTVANFLPKNLYEQFQNLANVYFLFVGFVQMIPAATTSLVVGGVGLPTYYQPLTFILVVSAVRAAMEDFGRHKADDERNTYLYTVLRDGAFTKVQSGDIKVGDIVKVSENDVVPADMLFLGSSLPQVRVACTLRRAHL
jgi:magnesium-transporting ATPase (P-type)